MILIVYVFDILLTGSDVDGIEKAKQYFKTQFVTKDMGDPHHFLGLKLLTTNTEQFFPNESIL